MTCDNAIFSVADQETLAFILKKASADESYEGLIIDVGDNSKLLSALSVNDDCREDACGWDGSNTMILVRSVDRAFDVAEMLQKWCNQHEHTNEVVVITNDQDKFQPFDPYNIVHLDTIEPDRTHYIMPSLPALRALGAIDPEGLFWEHFDNVALSIGD